MRNSFYFITVFALTMATTALATEIPIPPPPTHATKMLPVQANQPHCSRWTDDCVSCTRGADGEAPTCSNTGVACQPKVVRCLSGEIPDNPPSK